MDRYDVSAVKTRKKYVEAWLKTMAAIWKDRIHKLKISDTDNLYYSPVGDEGFPKHDKRYYTITEQLEYLEYGLWVELGVGRGVTRGNTHKADNDGWQNKRKRRTWMSPKYYASALNIRDFMAESVGEEFIGLFTVLDPQLLRQGTEFYKNNGLS